MTKLSDRIDAFSGLGSLFRQLADKKETGDPFISEFNTLIENAHHKNGWFTEENIRYSLNALADSLSKDKIEKWVSGYNLENPTRKSVAVILPGNIPFAGLHDMVSVLIAGHDFIGKVSSQDPGLLLKTAEALIGIHPKFKEHIKFTDSKLEGFDAVIATGSNNTGRYFEYYFGKYPGVVRKHMNSAAVLTGNETKEELKALADDIFLYFGLGCRNVSKLFVPEGYDFAEFLEVMKKYEQVSIHKKYMNNYDYYKSILLLNKTNYLDNGFLMLKKEIGLSSPVSIIHYEHYPDEDFLKRRLKMDAANIQCVVGGEDIDNTVPFGRSQFPELWDYADRVDTMEFLTGE